ncbi:MBG domain-containing protein [Marinifilum sp. N1E240]|uniref:MBG domain-containing protein n=1 Tax=Marinifilum sp. N1E240 TaxID=2608082 RepID=UPI00186B62E2|nr:MBG domain-containing protein [Marinifilum sp. N1E240]
MKIFTLIGFVLILLLSGSINSNAQKLLETFEESNNTGGNSGLGLCTDIVGDINNDGYDDIAITGRDSYYPTSRVFIYYGGKEFDDTPDLILEGDLGDASFGDAVSGAGDINQDGYDDIIVGSDEHNSNTGKAYIFYGGAEMDNVADLVLSGEGPEHHFGYGISRTGDINNDGYADVMIGAYGYNSNTGRVYIYYGGVTMDDVPDLILTGESPGDRYGTIISEAGDINNDEYADILIGAYGYSSNTGRVYVYHGGESMSTTPDLILTGETEGGNFGISISEIGDANNDGFDDFVVGGRSYYSDRRTFLYYGGLDMDNHYDNYLVEDNALSGYNKRILVSGAGDVNKDGYDDVVSLYYSLDHKKCRIYIHLGRERLNNYPDLTITEDSYYNGFRLTTGGDINGDGYDDLLFGHGAYDYYNGRVLLYYGSDEMDNVADFEILGEGKENAFGKSVSSAGDVNNDGFEDMLIGAQGFNKNTGRAYIYYGGIEMDFTPDVIMTGSEGVNTYFGNSVAGIGDVNNDGFDDVMIGAEAYVSNKGRAYIFFGGTDMDSKPDVILTGEEINNYFGCSFAGAGDVNNDGFDDVLVGAYGYNSKGRSYLFYGGSTMDNTPDLIMNTTINNNNFGLVVSGAGDLNKDGFDDFAIGALNGTEIYFGGSSMDNVSDVSISEGKASEFGKSVSKAGDVNKDGFDDIIVGDYSINSNTGRTYIFYGGTEMDNIPDVTLTGKGGDSYFGESVAGGGDINKDGYDDIAIGERAGYFGNERTYFYYGGAEMDNNPDVTIIEESRIVNLGNSISIVGDVNKDGFDEVMIGDFESPHNGKAFLYTMSPLPMVKTQRITDVTNQNATAKGNILDLGDTSPTAHGFCWSTDPSPTISNHILDKGAATTTGDFSGNINNLFVGTTYFIRAFATNDSGTNYGEELTFTTPKSDQAITFNALNNVTYGDANFELTATTSSNLGITYSSSDHSVAMVTGTTLSIVGVGTATITASQEGNDSYNAAAEVQQSITINKATLTVSADDKSKTYGDANPSFTKSYSGFVNGEDNSALTAEPTISSAADATTGVGSETITLTGGEADNYSFNNINGTLSINKAELVVTANNASKNYGDDNPAFTFNYSGFVNGEDASGLDTEPVASSTANALTNAGEVDITVSGGTDNNYSFKYVNATLSIQKTELTVTADDKSKIYGESNPELTISYSGFVNGEDASVFNILPIANSSANATTSVGSNLITVSGGVALNYNITYVNGTLDISKAELTVTSDDKSKTYGDVNPSFTKSYSGFVNGDDISALTAEPTISSAADATTGVGSASITLTGGESNHYSFNNVNGTLSINKAELVVTANNASKNYGDDNPAFTFNYSGFVNGEDASVLDTEPVASSTANALTNAGEVDITVSGGIDDNYNFNYVNATLNIQKTELTVTADDKSKTFGDANPEFTVSYTGFVNGDDARVLESEPVATSNADEKSDYGVALIRVLGGADDNYSFKYINGHLVVNKAELIVTANDKSKTYGENNPDFTLNYTGFVNDQDETVLSSKPILSTTADETTDAGSAIITVSGGVANDYYFTYINGTLDINKAKLTVSADDQTKTYGEANPNFTLNYNGFVNGENASVLDTEPVASSIANASTNVGDLDITVSGGADANYDFDYVNGTLAINKAELFVSADNQTKTYGEVNPEFTLSYTGFVNGDGESVLDTKPTCTSLANTQTDIGDVQIVISEGHDDNYNFNLTNGTLSISKAELTVTADDKVKNYGEVNPELTLSYSGFMNGEDATALTSQPTLASSADETTAYGSADILVSGGIADNYSFKYQNGTLLINKAIVTVTADDKTRNYGESNPEFTLNYSGFVNGENKTAISTEPTASCLADQTTEVSGVEITVSGGSADNYDFDYVNGMLLINKAELFVSADNQTKTYGEANPEFTLSYTGFVNGDNESVLDTKPTCTSLANTQTDIGDVQIVISEGHDDNYNFNLTNGILSITKAELTVIAEDKVKTYGEANPDLTLSYSGFVNGEDATVLTSQPTLSSNANETTAYGSADILLSGGEADNYAFKYQNGTLLINKAILTVTADDKTKNYGEANPELTLSYSGFVNGENKTTISTEPTTSCLATNSTEVSGVEITVSGGSADNYDFDYVNGMLLINKAELFVSADKQTKVYGEVNPEFTLSYTGFVNGDNESVLDSKPTCSSLANTQTDIGDVQIVISEGHDDNYNFNLTNGILSITKAELTVIAEDKVKTYGEANPDLTLSYSGFVNGENASVLTNQPSLASTADETTAYGSADILVSGGEADNYAFKYQNGILLINKAILTVTADDKTRNYGEINPTFSLNYNGFVNGENVTALNTEPTASCLADQTTEVSGVEITVNGGSADNYYFDYVNGMLLINKAELFVSADNQTKTYGEVNPEFTLSYTGFVNGDGESVLDTKPTCTSLANTQTDIGDVQIVISEGHDDNYNFNLTNGILSITKAELTVIADDKVKNYGEANPDLTLSYSGFVNGENASVLTNQPSLVSTADETTAYGSADILVSGGEADNYAFKYQNGTLLINKAILTATADDKTRNYGEINPTFSLNYNGFVNGENKTALSTEPTASCMATKATEVSGVEITVSGGSADNYDFDYVNGILLINKAELFVTADNQTKVYGEINPEFTLSYTGFVNGDGESVLDTKPTCSSLANTQTEIGDVDIVLNGGNDDNYNFNLGNGTLTINKAELTVSADNKSKTYGEVNPELTLYYSGFVNGEDESVLTSQPTVSSLADASSNAGSYAITLAEGAADNYSLTYADGALTIHKAELTVSADNQTREQGTANPDLTFSINGFVNGDDESDLDDLPVATCEADENSEAGDYDIIVDSGEDNNYFFNYNNGVMTVTIVTDISEIEVLKLTTYPNPTKDWLIINWTDNNTHNAEIQILNINGSLIKNINNYNNGSRINVSNLKTGTYILRIKIDNHYQSKRFIKI